MMKSIENAKNTSENEPASATRVKIEKRFDFHGNTVDGPSFHARSAWKAYRLIDDMRVN
jgi:hypothetical protein